MRLHVEITTASRTSGVAVACFANSLPSASVKARRSRSATGAVLCEIPSASSSDMLDLHVLARLLARQKLAEIALEVA